MSETMRETMRDAPGVGLAAPQVGMPLQIAVIEDSQEYIDKLPPGQAAERRRVAVPFHAIINPTLTVEEESPVHRDTVGFANMVGAFADDSELARIRWVFFGSGYAVESKHLLRALEGAHGLAVRSTSICFAYCRLPPMWR